MSELEVKSEVNMVTMPKIDEKAIEELKQQYNLFRKLQQDVLEEEVDYGYPAGKKPGQKPSLYKSGAEKLTRLFRLVPEFEVVKEIEEDDFIMYKFKCVLKTPSGLVIGTGYGACNSREKKHWSENPWVHQNTILKMAKKRAHVDAVLTGLGASNVFTQDLEDMVDEETQTEEMITQTQAKKLKKLIEKYAEKIKITPEDATKKILEKYNISSVDELTKQQASDLISRIENWLKNK